ncbi:thiazole synthase [Crenobacter caeni]|uniref:Thiazole synthase n=1 Tax=Crenobacter caeni TaxID=2705474 RepID=A0A6B2KU24_9NEIS|nr:thiazole synthase [Crenobacter caeni]NDV13722.1 thiazole synthase [Crenobacter caeni]
MEDIFEVYGERLSSRLLVGTAGYPSPVVLADAIDASGAGVVTVGLRRTLASGGDNGFLAGLVGRLTARGVRLLPNTAGCRTAVEAVSLARMARELYGTHWIKLEVTGDEYTLQPDPWQLLAAAETLVAEGFAVFPYATDDLVLCQRLFDAGCQVLMPWGAPIGSGQGLLNPWALRTLRERLPQAVLVVDAGLGSPVHAAQAMELGFDAVLLNSAIAHAGDPVGMARAFGQVVAGARAGYRAGVMAPQAMAVASTPVFGQPMLEG